DEPLPVPRHGRGRAHRRRGRVGPRQRPVVGLVHVAGRVDRARRPADRPARARPRPPAHRRRAGGRAGEALPAHRRAGGRLPGGVVRQAPRGAVPRRAGAAAGAPARAARRRRRPGRRVPEPGDDVAHRPAGPRRGALAAHRLDLRGAAGRRAGAAVPRQRAVQGGRRGSHPVALRRPPLPPRLRRRPHGLDPAAAHAAGDGAAGLRPRCGHLGAGRRRRVRQARHRLRPRRERGVPAARRRRGGRALRRGRGQLPLGALRAHRRREPHDRSPDGAGHHLLRRRRAGRPGTHDGERRVAPVPARHRARRARGERAQPGPGPRRHQRV
ncbi:MAG: hypothetical protein AVDCRST_MAG66-1780, partial [uncultured Pseudonocardia sp.]